VAGAGPGVAGRDVSTLPAPPRLMRALLRLSLPRDVREDVDGDLHELYVLRHADRGAAGAMVWYGVEACSFALRCSLDRLGRSGRALQRRAARLAVPSALDLRLAARMLARAPGLTIVAGFGMAVAVALGVGAFAMVNTRLFPDVPLHEGERVVALGRFGSEGEDERLLHDFLAWKRELRSVTDLGAFRTIGRNLIPATGPAEPIVLAEMTASGFDVARVPPLLGRTLLPTDEQLDAPPVVVIGQHVWQARFAGDASILGRELRIGRTVHTVVGVMPEGFRFPVNHGWWVPLRIDPAAVEPGTGPALDVFGRLAPGVTMEAAQAELGGIGERRPAEARVVPYTDVLLDAGSAGLAGPEAVLRRLIEMLLVVVAINVAVLVHARTLTRAGELAVRTALGATRGRVVAQLFAEALVLCGLATLAGLAIASIALGMFDRGIASSMEGGAPFWMRRGLTTGTVLYALGLAVGGAVIVGVWPALKATRVQLRAAMGSLGSGAKAQLGPAWTALIVLQVAITVAILPMALLKVVESVSMAVRPAGFPAAEYLSAGFLIDSDGEVDTEPGAMADSARATMHALIARLAAEPGVVGVTVTQRAPWAGRGSDVEVAGAGSQAHHVRVGTVDTRYFGLFGARVVNGRAFTAADAALPIGARPVVVNRTLARELLGGADPVGQRVRHRTESGDVAPWVTIVGVIDDLPAGVRTPGEGSTRMMYELELPGERLYGLLAIRMDGQAPAMFESSLRRIATSVDPTLQVRDASPLDVVYDEYTGLAGMMAIALALVAGSVLLLAAAGTHALVSFTVSERRREIGIHTALGAPPHRILREVLGRAAWQLALGISLGLVVAVLLDVASDGMLVGGRMLLLVPATALFMLAVGLVAAAGPVRRGLRVRAAEMLQLG
jgi:putative ABC transport system permease protein